jgi:hypothetical protein
VRKLVVLLVVGIVVSVVSGFVFGADITVKFRYPVSDIEGGPLTSVDGGMLYLGTESSNYNRTVNVPGGSPGGVGIHVVTGLVEGTLYYVNGTAFNAGGEGPLTKEVTVVAEDVRPAHYIGFWAFSGDRENVVLRVAPESKAVTVKIPISVVTQYIEAASGSMK